jgi:hypothetical protein
MTEVSRIGNQPKFLAIKFINWNASGKKQTPNFK